MMESRRIPYTLIEPCCGSLALTLHCLGAKRSLLPYQGSKWKHRKAIAGIMAERGYVGAPAAVVVADAGPWLDTAMAVLSKTTLETVMELLERFALQDPRAVYNLLTNCGLAEDGDLAQRAAEHLFLQRLSFSGKAVGVSAEGRWWSPGFNKSSAYGLAATSRFGAVKPMIPSLIRVLKSYEDLPEVEVVGYESAEVVGAPDVLNRWSCRRTVVFCDPPYVGSTPYPNGAWPRDRVVDFSLRYAASGSFVMVSEAEPIQDLVDQGWSASCIHEGRGDGSPFRGQQAEYVTYSL